MLNHFPVMDKSVATNLMNYNLDIALKENLILTKNFMLTGHYGNMLEKTELN
jgi:hypothetical protein